MTTVKYESLFRACAELGFDVLYLSGGVLIVLLGCADPDTELFSGEWPSIWNFVFFWVVYAVCSMGIKAYGARLGRALDREAEANGSA